MYEHFYQLTAEPFRLSPDARFCLRHPCYKKAKAYMQYALHRGEGFVMVTGPPGTGKSTLIDDLTSDLAESGDTVFANLTCTQIEADDLLRLVVLNFGLDGRVEHKALLLHDLEQYLLRLRQEGRRPLLLIDEAQDLKPTALEELRLLTNLTADRRPLLQIFLVGQEELRQTVLSPGLKQLHQRIVAACHLEPIDRDLTEEYVKHRLTQVGWKDDPHFSDDIFPFIHKFSKGVPRLINMICGRLLLHGMVEELHDLGIKDIQSTVEDLIEEQLLPINRKLQQNPAMFWK
jgi:general secretion pathway protein A